MTSAAPETRISRRFSQLRARGAKGLVAYLTAGDPSPDETVELVLALERGGADVVELGVPFSDPVADGPVILAAAERALRAGTSLRRVLGIAKEIRRRSQIPLLLFSYFNPLLRYGMETLARDCAEIGIDGCLVTDLCVEEAQDYVQAFRARGLDTVFLAAPTSTQHRLQLVADCSTGFVYLVSRMGVTGERQALSETAAPLAAAMRAVTDLPLAVGFGVSAPEHVAQVGRVADAAVVGSAFVRVVERNPGSPSLALQLESMARELKHGFDRNES